MLSYLSKSRDYLSDLSLEGQAGGMTGILLSNPYFPHVLSEAIIYIA